MTGVRISMLRCDGNKGNCDEEFTLANNESFPLLRWRAVSSGWAAKGRKDFCPTHVNEAVTP